ncbi:hypothetical protein RIF29_25994 [Crotalaria pallida]|uniref:Uncharacterized protein n=1 Tax=Crotalaria pallida TaxID=3830 RepID=A0AAN9EM83_CROPI
MYNKTASIKIEGSFFDMLLNPPLRNLRVEENTICDPHYMEDMCQRSEGPSLVKITVMPGFYVWDMVLRCKVLCNINLQPK